MSLLKACEPTCDELSQKSPAHSLKTTFWSAVGGRWSLESVSSMQSYRLHIVSKTSPILDYYCFVYRYMFHSGRCCWISVFLYFLFCMCFRSGRSLVLLAGTSATSLTTATGSVLCSTSAVTAKTAPSIGTPSSTPPVGKLTHSLNTSINCECVQANMYSTGWCIWHCECEVYSSSHILYICVFCSETQHHSKAFHETSECLAGNKAWSLVWNSLFLSLKLACVLCCQCVAQTAHCCFVNNTFFQHHEWNGESRAFL